ncbi:MAG: prephenate dehydrogenase [Eubacteriales bacterium]
MNEKMTLSKAKVTVVGAGLMGGSILKSLAKSPDRPVKITALEIDEKVLDKIKSLSLADEATSDAQAALEDADFVIISLYPAQTIKFIKQNIHHIKQGCVVTDICGVKREVMDVIPELIPESIAYVGGHPMAGREHKGFDYSTDNLFTNCRYIIDNSADEGKELVVEFAKTLGAGKIVESSAANHDEMIAYTSQLPHVLAVAYMLCSKDRNVEEFSAGSFRDVTRVAMINDEMWSELFCENKDMLVGEIAQLRAGLKELEDSIKDCDVENLRNKMKQAAQMREKVTELQLNK